MMTGYRKLEYIAGKKIVGNNTSLGIKTSPDMSIVMKYARQNNGWAVLLNTNTEYKELFNIGKSPDSYMYHNKATIAYQISTTEEPIVVRVKSLSELKPPVLKDGVYEFSVDYNLENTLWLGGIKTLISGLMACCCIIFRLMTAKGRNWICFQYRHLREKSECLIR